MTTLRIAITLEFFAGAYVWTVSDGRGIHTASAETKQRALHAVGEVIEGMVSRHD